MYNVYRMKNDQISIFLCSLQYSISLEEKRSTISDIIKVIVSLRNTHLLKQLVLFDYGKWASKFYLFIIVNVRRQKKRC